MTSFVLIRLSSTIIISLLSIDLLVVDTANILMIHPLPYKSHYNAFSRLAVALVKRGHNVTSIDYFPSEKWKNLNDSLYRKIDLNSCYDSNDNLSNFDESFDRSRTIIDKTTSMYAGMYREMEIISRCKIFRDPFASIGPPPANYDLVMTEIFYNEVYLAFAWKFRAPIIVLYANRLSPWLGESMAVLDNPSYVSYTHNPRTFDLRRAKFCERAYNAYAYLYTMLAFVVKFRPLADDIARKYFGENIPPIADIEANVSLVLSFADTFTNGPKANFPNVVEVGGLNIDDKPSSLPRDIQKFIDESPHGVIYFSTGSLLNPNSLTGPKRDAFLYAFSKIPQRILWKWNGDFPIKTDNIYAIKWMPQRDILAHPNVKLFITHGGSLGLNEAIFEGVPILGIPIYGDQNINLQNVIANGVGELLSYDNISKSVVLQKVQMILNNPRYKENMKKLSALYKDRPMSTLDNAVYWTEYVIRHNGAHHLRSPAINLSWYQYTLLDVIIFVTTITFAVLYICYRFVRILIKSIISSRIHSEAEKKSQLKILPVN